MPSLPLDLERLIFETAALQDTDHHHRIQIILVAKRVYEWIRPILFRVVVIKDRPPQISGALTIHNWPDAQITKSAQFVRHMLITQYSLQLLDILSTFPNIENFACWDSIQTFPKVLEKLNDLPLRRLSVALVPPPRPRQLLAFRNLTHLEIIFSPKLIDESDCKPLIQLPKLTHLSFTSCYVKEAAVLDSLKHCASLRVFISFANTDVRRVTKLDDPRYLVFCDRVSLLEMAEDWTRSANVLFCGWELAEVIIEARKANLFKDTSPYVLSRKTWMEHLTDDGMRWYEEWARGFKYGG